MTEKTYSLEEFRIINPTFCSQVDTMVAGLLDTTGILPSNCPDPELLKVYANINIVQAETNSIVQSLFGPKLNTRVDLSFHCQGKYNGVNLTTECCACPNKRLIVK